MCCGSVLQEQYSTLLLFSHSIIPVKIVWYTCATNCLKLDIKKMREELYTNSMEDVKADLEKETMGSPSCWEEEKVIIPVSSLQGNLKGDVVI